MRPRLNGRGKGPAWRPQGARSAGRFASAGGIIAENVVASSDGRLGVPGKLLIVKERLYASAAGGLNGTGALAERRQGPPWTGVVLKSGCLLGEVQADR